jgi:hypothetical protein
MMRAGLFGEEPGPRADTATLCCYWANPGLPFARPRHRGFFNLAEHHGPHSWGSVGRFNASKGAYLELSNRQTPKPLSEASGSVRKRQFASEITNAFKPPQTSPEDEPEAGHEETVSIQANPW